VRIALNAPNIGTGILQELCERYQANFAEVCRFSSHCRIQLLQSGMIIIRAIPNNLFGSSTRLNSVFVFSRIVML